MELIIALGLFSFLLNVFLASRAHVLAEERDVLERENEYYEDRYKTMTDDLNRFKAMLNDKS